MPFVKIIRPFNCFFAALTVFFGAVYFAEVVNYTPIIFAVISAVLIAAGGYVMNDFFDIPIDVINKPNRVLPSGKITPRAAYLYAVLLFILGILFGFLTGNKYCVGVAIFNTFILFFYAKSFKKTILFGNLLVAYSAGSAFIYGGLVNNNFNKSLILAVFAFYYTLIREFIKDAEDISGDSKYNARTLAVVLGKKSIVWVSFVPFFAITAYTFILFFSHAVSVFTFTALLLLVIIPLSLFLFYLTQKNTISDFAVISKYMKIDMFILLLIFFLRI
jgi:geranylgeranylglycerol-phosphate geranylgeranyltransferase